MLILLSLTTALLLSAAVTHVTNEFSGTNFVAMMAALTSGLLLSMALIFLPLEHMGAHARIQEIQAIQQTADRARLHGGRALESAAFQVKVAEANAWIAKKQYYRQTVFALWVPAVVDDLEPIE
jgi:hypothetical protein